MYRLAVPFLLVFFLLLIFALMLGQSLWVLPQLVKVSECSGPVEMRSKGGKGWRRLEKGAVVKKGDYIRTRRGGYAVLSWVDGTRLMPAENTIFEVRECQMNPHKQRTQSIFYLVQGKVWLRVRTKLNPDTGSCFEVSTPHLTASVRGTTFSVASTPEESSVFVREGRVTVTSSAARGARETSPAEGVKVQQGESARVAKTNKIVTAKMTPDELATWAGAAVLEPYLKVYKPLPHLIIRETTARVSGVTDAGCAVTVNDVTAVVAKDGTFTAAVPLKPGRQLLTVVSATPDGQTSTATREVVCEPEPRGGK